MVVNHGFSRNIELRKMSKYLRTAYIISPGTPSRVRFLLHFGLLETWMFSYNTLKPSMTTKDMNVEL